MNKLHFWKQSRTLSSVFAIGLALGGFGAFSATHELRSENPPAAFKLANPNEGPSRNSFAPAVKKTLPAVVNISSSRVVRTPAGREMPMDPFFRQFFGDEFGRQFRVPRERREQSLGSGVIVSPNGYILTNNHVVNGATEIQVTLSDKREFKARVVGTDAKTDIAVLRIDAADLPALTIGDSSKIQVGDFALAIGDPFGVGETVTMGIISATGRGNLGIEDYEDFIQTDAPINPGNSGGALINDRGELIGINTAILSHESGGNQGIGFAIPVNLARQVMNQILEHGKVTRAYLGISMQELRPAMAKALGDPQLHGALVGDVTANSPAQKAGIQRGDIVLEVNGTPVSDTNQLRNAVSMMSPGSVVKLKVFRRGSERELSAVLAELPDSDSNVR